VEVYSVPRIKTGPAGNTEDVSGFRNTGDSSESPILIRRLQSIDTIDVLFVQWNERNTIMRRALTNWASSVYVSIVVRIASCTYDSKSFELHLATIEGLQTANDEILLFESLHTTLEVLELVFIQVLAIIQWAIQVFGQHILVE